MEDRELYQTILVLQVPWTVSRVELREAEHAVHVWAEARPGTGFVCPDCGASAPAQVPGADEKIVFDKFHVLQHVSDAVDQVRKQESKALAAVGDATLKGTKYAWLRNPRTFSQTAWREFAALRDSTLQSARAWALKESLRRLWDYTYVGAARTFFRRWYWCTHGSRR